MARSSRRRRGLFGLTSFANPHTLAAARFVLFPSPGYQGDGVAPSVQHVKESHFTPRCWHDLAIYDLYIDAGLSALAPQVRK
jgi:hypothetical protein